MVSLGGVRAYVPLPAGEYSSGSPSSAPGPFLVRPTAGVGGVTSGVSPSVRIGTEGGVAPLVKLPL